MDFLNVKLKTLQLHKTPVTIYPTTQQNIPDLQHHHYKNLKYHIFQVSTSHHILWPSFFGSPLPPDSTTKCVSTRAANDFDTCIIFTTAQELCQMPLPSFSSVSPRWRNFIPQHQDFLCISQENLLQWKSWDVMAFGFTDCHQPEHHL